MWLWGFLFLSWTAQAKRFSAIIYLSLLALWLLLLPSLMNLPSPKHRRLYALRNLSFQKITFKLIDATQKWVRGLRPAVPSSFKFNDSACLFNKLSSHGSSGATAQRSSLKPRLSVLALVGECTKVNQHCSLARGPTFSKNGLDVAVCRLVVISVWVAKGFAKSSLSMHYWARAKIRRIHSIRHIRTALQKNLTRIGRTALNS
jgi:hypothetical protein